jgi:hypothetical protein
MDKKLPIDWLTMSDEPWTKYRALIDLQSRPPQEDDVRAVHRQMLEHPAVQALITGGEDWENYPIKRHNDAGMPVYKFCTLAEFGVQASDLDMADRLAGFLERQSPEGVFLSLVNVAAAFGGSGTDQWTWVMCDAPVVLYVLLAMGIGENERVKKAVQRLVGAVEENGWRCTASPDLGKFHGPGRRSDPCPIANVYALKALSLVPDFVDSPATRTGTEMLLRHWENRSTTKMYLFGMGTDFQKLKYPFIWYDILHVVEVLSRFPFVHEDPRFLQMVDVVTRQCDAEGRYTAGSMYQAWKGWSFADKKLPSPWLTFLVLRILKRIGQFVVKS